MLGEICIDLPRPTSIGIGERVARNPLAAKTGVIQFGPKRSKADFDIPQGFPAGQLGECHAKILIETGECFELSIAIVASHAAMKFVAWQEVHQLREDRSS